MILASTTRSRTPSSSRRLDCRIHLRTLSVLMILFRSIRLPDILLQSVVQGDLQSTSLFRQVLAFLTPGSTGNQHHIFLREPMHLAQHSNFQVGIQNKHIGIQCCLCLPCSCTLDQLNLHSNPLGMALGSCSHFQGQFHHHLHNNNPLGKGPDE